MSAQLRHENIVRLHTFIMTPTKYYLVMEYCEGGDLLHYINGSGLLSDELARTLFRAYAKSSDLVERARAI